MPSQRRRLHLYPLSKNRGPFQTTTDLPNSGLRAVAVIRMIKRMPQAASAGSGLPSGLSPCTHPSRPMPGRDASRSPTQRPASVLHSARPPLPVRAPRTKPPGIRPGWHRACLCTSGANQPRSCSADAHRHTRRRVSRTLSRRASHNKLLLTRRSERRYF